MGRPPNYGQNRNDVNRAKQAKQAEKLRAQEEAVERRRAEREAAARATRSDGGKEDRS
jgi:hypothetical protein